jgi:hypothetical protein
VKIQRGDVAWDGNINIVGVNIQFFLYVSISGWNSIAGTPSNCQTKE